MYETIPEANNIGANKLPVKCEHAQRCGPYRRALPSAPGAIQARPTVRTAAPSLHPSASPRNLPLPSSPLLIVKLTVHPNPNPKSPLPSYRGCPTGASNPTAPTSPRSAHRRHRRRRFRRRRRCRHRGRVLPPPPTLPRHPPAAAPIRACPPPPPLPPPRQPRAAAATTASPSPSLNHPRRRFSLAPRHLPAGAGAAAASLPPAVPPVGASMYPSRTSCRPYRRPRRRVTYPWVPPPPPHPPWVRPCTPPAPRSPPALL